MYFLHKKDQQEATMIQIQIKKIFFQNYLCGGMWRMNCSV